MHMFEIHVRGSGTNEAQTSLFKDPVRTAQ